MVVSAERLDPTQRDIATIDLRHLLHTTHVNGDRVPIDGETSRTVARFVTEVAEGGISDKDFDLAYAKAVGMMLGNIVLHEAGEPTDLNDKLFELYDVLETQHPRTIELLGRIRQESNFSEDHKVALNKLCLLVTFARFETEL